jgi:hypothetical protein
MLFPQGIGLRDRPQVL